MLVRATWAIPDAIAQMDCSYNRNTLRPVNIYDVCNLYHIRNEAKCQCPFTHFALD